MVKSVELFKVKLFNDYSIKAIESKIITKDIHRVERVEIIKITFKPQTTQEAKVEDYYRKLLDNFNYKHFYYSDSIDLTLPFSVQLNSENQNKCTAEYINNRHKMFKFNKSTNSTLSVIYGFVASIPLSHRVTLTLISRKNVNRLGVRYKSRGIDSNGNTSNFIETEQIITLDNTLLSSFIQLRGSIPFIWTHSTNLRYKPTLSIDYSKRSEVFFNKHFNQLHSTYSDSILCLDLVDGRKSESLLQQNFTKLTQTNNIPYIHFDYHRHCKGLDFTLIQSLLLPQLLQFLNYSTTNTTQTSFIRVNCIDCLDRTNSIQSQIAKHILRTNLQDNSISYSSAMDSTFNCVWADHADICSYLYASTPALKTDFTRYNKRTMTGIVFDGIHSIQRYYYNQLVDSTVQDTLLILVNSYSALPTTLPTPTLRSVLLPKLLFLALILSVLVRGWIGFFFLLISLFLLSTILRYGHEFTDKPTLTEQL